MAYLARWRLKLAAEMLLSSDRNVGEIAVEVGYASEAAFSRVFKREFGCPPAQFRRSQKREIKAPRVMPTNRSRFRHFDE